MQNKAPIDKLNAFVLSWVQAELCPPGGQHESPGVITLGLFYLEARHHGKQPTPTGKQRGEAHARLHGRPTRLQHERVVPSCLGMV
jgi:hypothetical protein